MKGTSVNSGVPFYFHFLKIFLNMYLLQSPPTPYTGTTANEPTGEPWLGLPTTTTTQTTQTKSTLDTILGIFDSVVEGISKVGSTITGVGTTAQQTATGIKDTFGDTASDVGADSINKSLKENLPYIIIGLAAFTLIIVLAIYATKRK